MAFRKPKWLRLDNAAKIFPAARRRNWSNVYRVAATLTEPVDPEILTSALKITAARFPSFTMCLRRAMFWYYLEPIDSVPEVRQEGPYPCVGMSKKEASQCAFRVFYYKNRIAVEFFHIITDGTGAITFLKTLTAEYIQQKYHVRIPACAGILDRRDEPKDEEIEDSFPKNEGPVSASRYEPVAYHLSGTKEKDGYLHITTGIIDIPALKALSKKYNVTITAYLASVMIYSILKIQAEKVPSLKKRKPVKVNIPINLRRFFPSKTLRNFTLCAIIGVDARMGDYTLPEIIEAVKHQMGLKLTEKELRAQITVNVKHERSVALKIVPLPIKNIVMKAVYNNVAERTSSTNISNLGIQTLPPEMRKYVTYLEFVLGILADTVYNCSAVSLGDKLRFIFTSNIKEHELERLFFTELVKSGIHVKIENNVKASEE